MTTDCCTQNAPPGGCRQGRDCPVSAAQAARTCEALGLCQHPERECVGACEQTPRVPFWTEDNAPLLLEDSPLFTAVCGAMLLLSLAVLLSAGMYIWARWLA